MKDPDVFLMDVAWQGQFAASDWLEPLGGHLENEGVSPEAFFQRVVKLTDDFDGRLLALPINVDGGLLYYRRDLLEKYGYEGPPETWAELIEMATKVQAGEREANPDFFGYVWQGAQYEGLVCNWLEVAASNDGGFLREGDGYDIDAPPNVEATSLMAAMIHEYRISPPNTFTEMKEEQVREAFQRGDALFERNWPYAWSAHRAGDSPVRDAVDIAPLPSYPGGRSASTLGGWHVGINRFSDNKPGAAKLVAFMLSPETQKALALRLGWNPGRVEVYRDPQVLEALPHFAELRGVFEDLTPRPTVPYYPLISEVMQRRLNRAISGEQSAAEAMSAADGEVDDVVQRYEGR
jgi:multiple sugar transport system substrate-binding protein